MRLAFLLLVCALVATPVQAQIWDGGGSEGPRHAPRTDGYGPTLSRADENIRDGRRAGQLSRREARSLRGESGVTQELADRYRTGGGLTPSAEAEITARVEALQGIVNAQRLNGVSQITPPSPR